MRPPHLLILCFLVIAGAATAQEYSYARYDVKDGLAGSVVYHGVEDKDGFLWFATETGVSRFDGTHFRNFTRADGLPDNEILKLFVDAENRVWMLPFRNAICYYWKGRLYNQQNDPLLKKLSVSGRISDIVENSQGDILLADSRSFHLITANRDIKTISVIDNKRPRNTSSIGMTSDDNFAAYTLAGNGGIHFTQFTPAGKIISDEMFWDRRLPGMIRQNLLISPRLKTFARNDSLIFFNRPGQPEMAAPLPKGFINLSVINDSICTINTDNGAFYCNVRTGSIIRQVLPGMIVNSVMQDKEGNSWVLTAGKGLYRIGTFEFINFRLSEDNKHDRAVFSLCKKGSLLYAGSEKGLLFTVDVARQHVHARSIAPASGGTRILSIVPLPTQQLFLGTDIGIFELGKPGWPKKMTMSVKSMQADRDSLLTGYELGLVLISRDGIDRHLVRSDQTTTCGYVLGKSYYMGTLNGLYLRGQEGELHWLGQKHPQLQGRITDLKGSADSTLWVATHGEGVVGYKNGQVTAHIRQSDGLSSDICRTLFVAGKDLWIGTDKGLNRIQEQEGRYKITTFTSADGLIADIINAVFVEGSQVYVGTPAGLTTFDANMISLNSICKLRMTAILASGRPWSYDTTGFILPPRDNGIRFDYAGISFRSTGDITYRYRLKGLDDNWQTTRETFLSYPSLPSGEYELQLVATNKFGVESRLLQIPFQVDKILWEKTWFRIGILLMALILIWLFVNTRIKKIRRQNDEKIQINNRIAELEQMALKAQMNPHFIFNSLNSVQQYVIDKDLLGANKFITEFSRLIRLTLDISAKSKISIYEEVSYLTTYLELEKTKFEDKFTYSVQIDPELDPGDWFIPPMILQPYVENSIRHGMRYRPDRQGHIRVSFRLDAQYLECEVTDNGVGRKKAGQYKSEIPIEYQSKGMTLTARRIEMLNRNQVAPVLIDIEDLENNHIAAGTRVTLRFPLHEAAMST